MATGRARRAKLIFKVLQTLRIQVRGDLFQLEQRESVINPAGQPSQPFARPISIPTLLQG
jgi:hypothetical protein